MCNDWKLPRFDSLVAFHQRDPVGYERFRVETLSAAIAAAPAERRPALAHTLRAIELTRQRAGSPLEAAACAQALMLGSLAQLNETLHRLQHLSAEAQTVQLINMARESSRNRP